MNKLLLLSSALVASALAPAAASAQAIPGAIVAVVDLDKVTTDCTACKSASATLRSQATALQTRQKTLATPLETEQKSIQAAIDALAGKEPDAALQARAKAWETKRQAAAQEIGRGEQQLQRNQAYITQQIRDKLGPIYQQVMTKRGANIMVEVGSTLATSASLDVTSDVLTALNTAMPTVQTQAPAAPQQQQPQGR
jgi:Skp family chaperone for outer membrane proteins